MTRDDILNLYFEWLFDMVCGLRFADGISFRKLLAHLHNTEFRYSIPNDKSRAREGENLRHRFAITQMPGVPEYEILDILAGPCSVLEMMVALAIYAEEHIMSNPQIGNRTGQWFWNMVTSLGLGSMTDDRFDLGYIDDVIVTFLNRDYRRDGRGGLFTIRKPPDDMRLMEIWIQMCWYLDTIT